jgi:hypothetical protein
MKITMKRKIYLFTLTTLLALPTQVYAAGNWGVNFKKWLLDQASAIAVGVVVIIMIPLLFKKAWMPLLATLFASSIALYFIFNPDSITAIGKVLAKILFDTDLNG